MSKLTSVDFPELIPLALLDELNKIDAETKELESKHIFCMDHNFRREAEYLAQIISTRTRIYVSMCNAMGKYF